LKIKYDFNSLSKFDCLVSNVISLVFRKRLGTNLIFLMLVAGSLVMIWRMLHLKKWVII